VKTFRIVGSIRGSAAAPWAHTVAARVGGTSHQLAERAPCPMIISPPEATVPGLA
jgi:hypothetical protein